MRYRLTLARRRSIYGICFIFPFLLGFVALFLYPFIQAILFSLSELRLTPTGYTLTPVGLANYREALFVQPDFLPNLTESLLALVSQVPLILIFSLFAASLLNQKFRGRVLARMVFFLPVIMGAGIILAMESQDYVMDMMQAGLETQRGIFSTGSLHTFLFYLGMPPQMLGYVVMAVENIPVIIRASGIQILIFLAGLQSIPPSLYEASQVEGATGWENFWLITFPVLSPLILTNVVYSIIDFLTGRHNPMLSWIQGYIFGRSYGVGTAMALMYFSLTVLLLGIVVGIINRYIFYQE